MSNSQEKNDPIKPASDSLTSGLTSFPGGGTSELPPLPRGRRVRALGRAVIFAIAGTGAGAVAGLLWGGLLMWGSGWTGVAIQTWVMAWMIVGFIAGIMAQPGP